MKNIKNELQNIICSDEPFGKASKLKKVQNFLRRNAKTSAGTQKKQFLKSEETVTLIDFAQGEDLFYQFEISEDDYITAGAEQRVFRYDDFSVIKTNDSIFYSSWLDYFNNLLIHNYFFPATAYDFLGFKIIQHNLYAVVKQDFIIATEPTNLRLVNDFLDYNGFTNTRNNDYINRQIGLIFEDLHDENVLSKNGILFFIDTVFYLLDSFYE
ncbi:MAG: hypothetical protein JSS98_09950 [Bacteroidetes bacterium]|nr:hypothetical protein [Bacteroidota bacterium]